MSELLHDHIDSAERKDNETLHDEKSPAEDAAYVFVPNPELEKRILRKIDLRMIPAAMVMVSAPDRLTHGYQLTIQYLLNCKLNTFTWSVDVAEHAKISIATTSEMQRLPVCKAI